MPCSAQVYWSQIGLPAGAAAIVRDLYAERDLGTFADSFSASVTAHDVVGGEAAVHTCSKLELCPRRAQLLAVQLSIPFCP